MHIKQNQGSLTRCTMSKNGKTIFTFKEYQGFFYPKRIKIIKELLIEVHYIPSILAFRNQSPVEFFTPLAVSPSILNMLRDTNIFHNLA